MAAARPVAVSLPLRGTPRHAPGHARLLAAALAGGLAGLAAGAACMAWAPAVGRGADAGSGVDAPFAPSREAGGRSPARATAPVAAVLAPAVQSGDMSVPGTQAEDRQP